RRRTALLPLPATPSAHRRRVVQPALGPQAVEAALDAETAVGAEMARKELAVIADGSDDPHRPVAVEPEYATPASLGAEQPTDARVPRGLREIAHIGRGDVELLRIDQHEQRPTHDIEPTVVALTHRRAERLLGDDLRQH